MSRRAAVLLVLVVAAAAAAAAAVAAPAWGCTCTTETTKEKYDRADAAFIGTIESRTTPSGNDGFDRVVYTYVVEESFKRALGAKVEIATSTSGATCGYDAAPGARHAMVLHDESRDQSGRYGSGICNIVGAEELRQAAKGEPKPPPPPPDSPSPPPPPPPPPSPPPPSPQPRTDPVSPQRDRGGLLVAGRFGGARLLLLDPSGATIARGTGRGRTIAVTVCGGGRRISELVVVDGRRRRVVRALPSLAVVPPATGACSRDGSPTGRTTATLGTARYALRGRRLHRDGAPIRRFATAPAALVALPALARAASACARLQSG